MTSSQISTILKAFGNESQDKDTELKQIQSIHLRNSAPLFPSSNYKFHFDSTNELLYVYKKQLDEFIMCGIYPYLIIFNIVGENPKHRKQG